MTPRSSENRSRSRPARGTAVGRITGGVVVAVVLAAGCADDSGEREVAVAAAAVNEAQADGGGWRSLAAQAEWVEAYETVAGMGREADVVVIAQATGVDGVSRSGPDGEGGAAFAQVRFQVVRAVSDWDADSVVVEVDEPMSLTALEEQVAGFPPALLLLREKGSEEAGSYRLVNGQGLWTEQPDGGLYAPMDVDRLEDRVLSELEGMTGLDDLADHLEAARAECEPECGRGPRPSTEPTGG